MDVNLADFDDKFSKIISTVVVEESFNAWYIPTTYVLLMRYGYQSLYANEFVFV